MADENIHIRDISNCYLTNIADKLDGQRIAAHNWQTIANELCYDGGDIERIVAEAERKRKSPSLILLEDWGKKNGSKAYILRDIFQRNNRIDCVAILEEASRVCNVVKFYAAIQEIDGSYKVHGIQTTRDADLREALANVCEIDNYEIEPPQKPYGWETKAIVYKSQEITLKRKSLNQLSPEKEVQDCTVTTSSPQYNIEKNMEFQFGGEPSVENNTGAVEKMETDVEYSISNEMVDEHDYIFPKFTNEEHVYNVLIRQSGSKLLDQSLSVPYDMAYFNDDDAAEFMETRSRSNSVQPCSNHINVKTDDNAKGGDEPATKECSPPCCKTISFPKPIPSSATACEELLESASRVSGWMPEVHDISSITNILMKVKNADGHYALWLKADLQKVVLSVTHLGVIYNYRIYHGCPDKYHIFRGVHVATSVGKLLEYHKINGLQKTGQIVKHISLKTPVVRDTRTHPTRYANEARI